MAPPLIIRLNVMMFMCFLMGVDVYFEWASGKTFPMGWFIGVAKSGRDKKTGVFKFIKGMMFEVAPERIGADLASTAGLYADCAGKDYKMNIGDDDEVAVLGCYPDEFSRVMRGVCEETGPYVGYDEAMITLRDFARQRKKLKTADPEVIPRTWLGFGSMTTLSSIRDFNLPKLWANGYMARMITAQAVSPGFQPKVEMTDELQREYDGLVQEAKEFLRFIAKPPVHPWYRYPRWRIKLTMDDITTVLYNDFGRKMDDMAAVSDSAESAIYSRAEENLVIIIEALWLSREMETPTSDDYHSNLNRVIDEKLFRNASAVYSEFLKSSLLLCSLATDGDKYLKRFQNIMVEGDWLSEGQIRKRFRTLKTKNEDLMKLCIQFFLDTGEIEERQSEGSRGTRTMEYRWKR
jgi:hypothetical protein